MTPYIPAQAQNMKDATSPRLMVALVGEAGSGKTTSALTFPNPFVVDVDRSLTAQIGVDLPHVPFYDDDFCITTMKMQKLKNPDGKGEIINKRDGIAKWIREEAPKFQKNQTLIFDSWTSIQRCFDIATRAQPVYTNKGEKDKWAFWQLKVQYSSELLSILQSLPCNVVVTFHELKERDPESGELVDTIQPLMQGKFIAEIGTFFSDFFRQVIIPQKNKKGELIKINGNETLPNEMNYMWQIRPNEFFKAKSRMNRAETFVPAHYNSFNYGSK